MKTGVERGVERAGIRRRGEGTGTKPVPETGRAAAAAAEMTPRTGGVRDTEAAAEGTPRVRYRKVFACAAEAIDSPDEEQS
jgi:hypothetical protein